MYIESVRRSSGVLLIALATMLASFVVIAPEVQAASPYSEYEFYFINGQVVTGTTLGNGFEAPIPGTDYTIHVSCSDVFVSGWSSNGAFPNPTDHPDWEIASYSIDRYKGNGTYHFTCGETFTTGSITVKKDATPASESFNFDLNGEIPNTPTGGSATFDGDVQSVLGDNVDSYTWNELLAGTYTLSELMSVAQADAGWQYTGVSCDSGTWSANGASAQIALAGNQHVTCTFTNLLEEPPPPVSAVVVLGDCNPQTGLSAYTVVIDPTGGAQVDVTGPGHSAQYTADGGASVEPGTYNWTAVALGDYELTSAASGSFTAEPCAQEATVTVSVACISTDSSLSNLTVVISPAGSAEVTIAGQTVTGSGDTIQVEPGSYPWTATADPLLWDLTASSGTVEAIDCDVPDVTVEVVPGTCQWNGQQSVATIEFTINPDGGAEISFAPGTFSSTTSGSILAVADDYTWTATAQDGYELKGDSSGEFTVAECPPPASIGDTVWHDVNNNGIQEDGEDGIEGVTVNLVADNTVVDSTTTDANGQYLFTEVPHGDYSIGFVIPDGWNASPQDQGGDDAVDSDGDTNGATAVTTLDPGEEDLTWDMGLYQNATIIVEKIVDPVTEDLFDFTGDISATLGDGESASASVAPGTYTVTETIPENWALIGLTCTAGGSGDLETGIATYEVLSGDEVTCTYTNTNEGTVIITKETDVETDDTFEFTIGGETHTLASGEEVVLTLPSGDYDITENILVADAWELIAITCSGETETDIEALTATVFVPPTGTVGCTFVNSELEDPLGVLGDYVWNDADKDGIQDADESGLANVTVELIPQDIGLSSLFSSAATFTTTTNDAGIYVLANVPAGDYIMSFTAPTDFEFSPANVGDDALDSDVVSVVGSVGQTAVFSLAAGSADTTTDAGISRIEVQNSTTTTVPETTTTTAPGTTTTTTPGATTTTVGTTVTTVGSTPTTVAEVIAAEVTPEPDTQVLGIQTELPETGFGDHDSALLALALVMAGMGVLLLTRKEEDFATISGFTQ